MKIKRSISLNKDNWPKAFNDWNKNNNNALTKWLESGEMIKIENGQYVSKEQFIKAEAELNTYLNLVSINHVMSQPNSKDEITSYCFSKENAVKNLLETYFEKSPRRLVFIRPLWLICTSIAVMPIHVIKAVEMYPSDNLSYEQLVYYRQKYINNKAQIAESKFKCFKADLEKFFNKQLAVEDNKNHLMKIFLFTEQFINELRYFKPAGLNSYFETKLFRTFFSSIISFKNRYKEIYEDFEFENINNIIKSLETSPLQQIHTEAVSRNLPEDLLKSIWLPEAKISVNDFLILGIEKGIWNEKHNIITQRGSLYGTGKTLLGSLSIALKGYTISQNTDYKEIGKAFCLSFNLEINENTKEPYKAFSSGNRRLIIELKRAFKISL